MNNNNGYVSVETVIIVALILAVGVFLLSVFVLDLSLVAEEATVNFEDAYIGYIAD